MNSPTDMHPSRFGMDFYANALTNTLFQTGLLKKAP